MHGLSLMDNADAAKWLALIPNRLANPGARSCRSTTSSRTPRAGADTDRGTAQPPASPARPSRR